MIKLTDGQRECLDGLESLIDSPNNNKMLIKGYAGTGKTYLITYFIKDILRKTNKKVALTAPTNKAVSVLGDYIGREGVKLSTIHSLMGLRGSIGKDGSMQFKQIDDIKVAEYDIIVIDEASMINDELLIGNKRIKGLFELVENLTTKVIFVGDGAQIPPVGSVDSIPMSIDGRLNHEILMGELTEVVRQGTDNPIIDLVTKVRDNLRRDCLIPVKRDMVNEGNGVKFLEHEDLDYYLRKYYTSSKSKEDAGFVKVIAWRNKTVDAINKRIRTMIYGDAPKICKGERLIATDLIVSSSGEEILYTVNSEFTVEEYIIKNTTYDGATIKCYRAKVFNYDYDGEKVIKEIDIVHEDSEKDFNLIRSYYKSEAKGAKSGSFNSSKYWQEFYQIRQYYADVKYGYAVSAHKSQGSTYTNVFVISDDIDANFNIVERNRIKYTAFTRPSNRLFIVG